MYSPLTGPFPFTEPGAEVVMDSFDRRKFLKIAGVSLGAGALYQVALEEARLGLSEGGIPIGAALF